MKHPNLGVHQTGSSSVAIGGVILTIAVDGIRAAGFRVVGHLTFPKRYTPSTGFLRAQHENAYLLAKGRLKEPEHAIGDVIDWTYSGNKLHPTQKPLPVLLPLVDTFFPKQGVVLDPFASFGSTLLAARMLGGRMWA